MPVAGAVYLEQLTNKHNIIKNSKWREANQKASIYGSYSQCLGELYFGQLDRNIKPGTKDVMTS